MFKWFIMVMAGCALWVRGESWQPWAGPVNGLPQGGSIYCKVAVNETHIYYSTMNLGIFRASRQDRVFDPMPLTGLPELWSADTADGFDVWFLALTPQGTVVVELSPHNLSPVNTVPLIYWFDEANARWVASTVQGKSYPYTYRMAGFSQSPDGSLWTCSGYTPYVYRSTNGGRDFVAFNVDDRMPAAYFPNPASGATSAGLLFSILATSSNELFLGTESFGVLHSQDAGESWTSVAADFTDAGSSNPLGRAGNASFGGRDRFGNVLCVVPKFTASFPGSENWLGHYLIGYRPSDGSYFDASAGFPAGTPAPFRVLTTRAGVSFTSTTRLPSGLGGIFRSSDGKNWSVFSNGISVLSMPTLPGQVSGDGLCVDDTVVFAAYEDHLWTFDTMPPPVTNRPPQALSQYVTLTNNDPGVLVQLEAVDPDGPDLSFQFEQLPTRGQIQGTPPAFVYVPSNTFNGTDVMTFRATDGIHTSALGQVTFAINAPGAIPPSLALLQPQDRSWVVAPTNIVLGAAASHPTGVRRVDFRVDRVLVGSVTNPPWSVVWTNAATGSHLVVATALGVDGGRAASSAAVVEVLAQTPRLDVRAAGTNVIVRWSLALDGFMLESSTDPGAPWNLEPAPPLDEDFSMHAVTVPAAGQRYFRLWHP